MCHRRLPTWLPTLALVLAACADGGPVAPVEDAGLSEDGPLSAVLPDLAPDSGTAGTDRYVPTLERVLRRSVRVIQDKRGEAAAGKVVAEARSLAQAVREARQAGDTAAVTAGVRELEAFEARVGLRVFGVKLLRYVHNDASNRLDALRVRLTAASDAGRDVRRLENGALQAWRYLAGAREAAGYGRFAAAMVGAAHALDVVVRLDAALQ
jgi:hypothetical protein